MQGRPIKFTLPVTVSGGSGSAGFNIPITNGVVCHILSIDGPNGATYDFVVRDSDGYAVCGASTLTDDSTHYILLPLQDSATFYLTNATDGSYNVRIWALLGR